MTETQFSPELLKQFKILGKLGEGGMSHVYLGEQRGLGRKVALKFLAASSFPEEESLERFKREAQALATLNHENILTIYGSAIDEDRPYLILEYLPGETLREALNVRRRYPPIEAAEIVYRVARALEYSHRQGVIHRDVKPENVLVGEDGDIRVFDFGLAKLTQGATMNLTEKGIILGTPSYIAPEQVTGSPPTKSTDIYGVGALLYELLSGQPPHGEGHDIKFLRRKVKEEPPPIEEKIPGLDPDLARIINGCLRKKVKDRAPTMGHVAHDLAAFLGLNPSRPIAMTLVDIQVRVRRSRWGRPLAAIATVLVLALIIVGLIARTWVAPVADVRQLEVSGATHAITATWSSETPYVGRVEVLDPKGLEVLASLDEAQPIRQHFLAVAGLGSNQDYIIRVGDAEGVLHVSRASTIEELGVPEKETLLRGNDHDKGTLNLRFRTPVRIRLSPRQLGVSVTHETTTAVPLAEHRLRITGAGVAFGALDMAMEVTDLGGSTTSHFLRVEGLIEDIRRFQQLGMFEQSLRRLMNHEPLDEKEEAYKRRMEGFLHVNSHVLSQGLRRSDVPIDRRRALYEAVDVLQSLERAARIQAPDSPRIAGQILENLTEIRVEPWRESAAPPRKPDREFTPEENNFLLEGMDVRDAQFLMNRLSPTETLENTMRFDLRIDTSEPGDIQIVMDVRCLGEDRYFKLNVNDKIAIRIWGRGATLGLPPADGRAFERITDPESIEKIYSHQLVRLALPREFLEPGSNRFTVSAHPIVEIPACHTQDACVPSVNRVWLLRP